jgi:hypothetical protein
VLISEIVGENRGRFPVEEGIELQIKVLNPSSFWMSRRERDRVFGSLLAVAFGALRLHFFVLADGFGKLEGLAAFSQRYW